MGNNVQNSAGNNVQSGFSEVEVPNMGYGPTGASSIQRVGLPIVPVIVRDPVSQHSVHTCAFLDKGSSHTFCSEECVKQLQVKGDPCDLSPSTLEKANSHNQMDVASLEVSDMDPLGVCLDMLLLAMHSWT